MLFTEAKSQRTKGLPEKEQKVTIKDIEKAVTKLPAKKFVVFRTWFYRFENNAWDKQFEEDVKKGKLDAFAEEAVRVFKKGHCREW